jgi:hypothetical protein
MPHGGTTERHLVKRYLAITRRFFEARPVLLEEASNNNVRAQYLYATLIRTYYYRQYDPRYWCQWMTVAAINGDEDARGAWKGCLLEDAEYEILVQKAALMMD